MLQKKSRIERLRIPASRALGAVLVIGLLVTETRWSSLARPIDTLLYALGIALVAIGSIGRLWCSLYIAGYKTYTLIDLGPYSICRHPLYFFSLVGAVGLGFSTETFTVPALVAVVFPLAYIPVMKSEEKKLTRLHNTTYPDYMSRVPMFFPRWSLLKEPDEYLVNPKLFKRHMFSALWFIWLAGIIEIVEVLKEMGVIPVLFHLY